MVREDVCLVFDSLTHKQRQTLDLAARHRTSKEIAQELGVAPVTVDKRIEGIRARLGNVARPELLRLFREWDDAYGQAIDDPIILAETGPQRPQSPPQHIDHGLLFEDSLVLDARTSWSRESFVLRPGLKPADLGVIGKLAFIIGGAVAIMMVAVLSMAFADSLMAILSR